MNTPVIRPSEGFDYYLPDTILWNNFQAEIDKEALAISGSVNEGWIGHVRDAYGVQGKALFVSCGNGWVERACFQHGVIREAWGFDVMAESIATAKAEAARIGLPATYEVLDGNDLQLDWSGFDMIVNNGSVHHIAYIDRFLRRLRPLLKEGGLYVIMDYTGPHRNQYEWKSWSKALELNNSLPEKYRKRLRYPHMPTMLALDPTEAVHSELQMSVTRRYFDVEHEVRLGGGVGYEIMNGNRELLRDQHTSEGRDAIKAILAADAAMTAEDPASNLFTFAVCRPKKTLPAQGVLDRWAAEEEEREAHAARNGGRYYPPTAVELIYNELANAEYALSLQKQPR